MIKPATVERPTSVARIKAPIVKGAYSMSLVLNSLHFSNFSCIELFCFFKISFSLMSKLNMVRQLSMYQLPSYRK